MDVVNQRAERVVMRQECFCGWNGDVEDQRVIYVGDGVLALECPRCGRQDRLLWMPELAREAAFRVASERQESVVRTADPVLVD